jgi:hypothetical protein
MRTWIVLGLVAGCGGHAWRVAAPAEVQTVPLDGFVSVPVQAVAGGIEPQPVQSLTAICADESICEARVVGPGDVRVVGKRVGSTTLEIDAKNPIDHEREKRSVRVAVVAAPERPTLALGAPLPAGTESIHRSTEAQVGHCVASTGTYDELVAGAGRADVRLYTCTAFVDEAGERRFRACGPGLCAGDDAYLLCAQTRSNAVVGTAILARADSAFAIKSTGGELDAGTCTPR